MIKALGSKYANVCSEGSLPVRCSNVAYLAEMCCRLTPPFQLCSSVENCLLVKIDSRE